VFAITAALPLLTAIAAFAIADRVEGAAPSGLTGWREQWGRLRQAFTRKEILLPAVFLFLWQATPTADSAFFFFTTNELHFNPEFLGTVRLVTSVAGLAGIWLFQRYLRGVPIRQIFVWTTLLSAALGLTGLVLVTHANRALGIDDRWFSLGDSVVLAVAGRIAFMPVLVLAARLCPEGIEATLFALLMSVLNLGSLLAYQSGAWLTHVLGVTETNFTHLPALLIIANLSTLLPLPLARWLPEDTVTSSDAR
jgi:folate/biopterin transporter